MWGVLFNCLRGFSLFFSTSCSGGSLMSQWESALMTKTCLHCRSHQLAIHSLFWRFLFLCHSLARERILALFLFVTACHTNAFWHSFSLSFFFVTAWHMKAIWHYFFFVILLCHSLAHERILALFFFVILLCHSLAHERILALFFLVTAWHMNAFRQRN